MTWVVAGGRCPWQGLAEAATGLGRHEDDADELHGHGRRRNWTDSRAGRRLGNAGLRAGVVLLACDDEAEGDGGRDLALGSSSSRAMTKQKGTAAGTWRREGRGGTTGRRGVSPERRRRRGRAEANDLAKRRQQRRMELLLRRRGGAGNGGSCLNSALRHDKTLLASLRLLALLNPTSASEHACPAGAFFLTSTRPRPQTTSTGLPCGCISRRIITDIARGLYYLHEGCRQRIAHLDIKPHNILLDDNFNAEVADFGLSKLIDREESRVVTRMRGTPGYMAPEWLTPKITEKVDVYSFGTVVMAILSGRKNIDYSQPDESAQLIMVLREKAMNSQLEDMIDRNGKDMHFCNKEEVIEIMKLAVWCLQSDSNRRPSMSVVVKFMEGERRVESDLNYNFFDLSARVVVPVGQPNFSVLPNASVLSAPR
nr:PTI1-like tyrosine-protein kinase 3 [Aegilops tauschii subsp. strangulata]